MQPKPPAPSPFDVLDANFTAAARTAEELPPPVGLEIAFAGRSNVGKSSLLNRLMGRRALARTSSTPGCTRAVQFYEVRTRDDLRLSLVDLPGYGYAQRSKEERALWADLIERYLLERPTLIAVAVLVDARRGLEQEERDLLQLLAEPSPRRRPLVPIVVATKLDKVPRPKRVGAVASIAAQGTKTVGFSTEVAETTLELWRRLRAAIT